jgi:tRNA A37 threonylcarbamoyladenosine synthetase subunit TsaC/SUA5/YrdC
LIRELGRPVLAITAKLKGVEYGHPEDGDRELFLSRFDKIVDVIIDNQEPLNAEETTILDLTDEPSVLVREGLGMGRLEEALALEDRELLMPEGV